MTRSASTEREVRDPVTIAAGHGGAVRLPCLARLIDRTGAVEVVPADQFDRAADGVLRAAGRGSRFAATATWRPAPVAGADRWDVTLEIACIAEAAVEAGVVVAVLLDPTDDPGWLVPGLFYGENRVAACRRRYPRFVRTADAPDDLASSHWSFRSDRAATPSVSARDGRIGATLATRERSPLGPTGVGFAAHDDATEVHLAFPWREEPVVYDGFETARPAEILLHAWQPGERAALEFRLYLHGPEPRHRAPAQRDLHAWLAADAPMSPWVPIDEAARLAAHGLLAWHYRPEQAVLHETAAFERRGDGGHDEPADRRAMHVAWLSGTPAAHALLAHGRRVRDERAAEAGSRVLDAIAGNLAPCGTFWGQWTATDGWGKGWTPGEDRLHARTLGEAATFMLRSLRHVDPASPRSSAWRDAVAANLAFVAARQRDDGALPAQWHGTTGAVESWEGSAALAWVPPLAEGARVLGQTALLDTARRAGTFHAAQVAAGFLFGAPEDVDLAPTSEDGYVALMAYVALADAETDPAARARWVDLARAAADWMLTFRYTYNVDFEQTTLLGRYDFRSRGADNASPANQHLHAYGLICTPELVRLAELTGDPWYRDRARETLACFRQFIAREDGDFNARRGMAPERYYQTNCFGPKGAIGPLSHAWSLALLLYACDAAADLPTLTEASDGA